MKKIAWTAVPLACAIAAPFFVSADELSEDVEGVVCVAPARSGFGQSKLASASKNNGNAKNSTSTSGMNGQITPPAGPLISNGVDVFITADFIYWKGQVDGLNYAFSGGVPGGGYGSQTNAPQGKMQSPDFKYEPGFKVGLGVLCNHDNWDVFAQYTWLQVPTGSTKDTVSGGNATTNIIQGNTTWGYLGVTPIYSNAYAKWGLDFNVLDAELGRNFWISKRLSLRPHLGMKFSWMTQNYHVHGNALVTNGVVTTGSLAYKWHQTQFGVGVRSGLDSAYYLWNKWSIFGELGFSGMWNSFDTSRKDIYQSAPGAESFTNASVKHDPHTVSMVLEMTLGLRFETIFSKGQYMYMIQAGWETQTWFNQGQFIRFDGGSPLDMTFEGLTIKTGFWF